LYLLNEVPHHEEWESCGTAPTLFTLELDGGESSISRPGRFIPGSSASGIYWIEVCVGPKVGLEVVEYRKFSCACRELNPGYPDRSPSLHRLSYCGPFPFESKINMPLNFLEVIPRNNGKGRHTYSCL
jgi:hypothetical protein